MKNCFIFSLIFQFLVLTNLPAQNMTKERRLVLSKNLIGTLGTYATPPMLENGKVDNIKLINQLKELHANTYHWLMQEGSSDINGLIDFLPIAKKENIKVWITLLPPSESPPLYKNFSEPYRLDFVKWALIISKLSLEYNNIVAWSIDDFVHNLKLFTPTYVNRFLDSARNINPSLAFLPCSYFKQITPEFAKNYGLLLDGILFPYRNESVKADLKDPNQVTAEIEKIRSAFNNHFFVFLDVYASPHSQLGATTAEYVKTAIDLGINSADGVMIYCHPNPISDFEKYAIIQNAFKTGYKKIKKHAKKRLLQ